MFVDLRSQWESQQPPFHRRWLGTVLESWVIVPVALWAAGTVVQSVEAKVPFSPASQAAAIAAWEPAEEVRQGRRFVPQEAAAPAQTPFARPWLPAVASWEPEDQPAQRRYGQIVSVDPPPPRAPSNPALAQWGPVDEAAQPRKLLPQEEVAAAPAQPFTRLSVAAHWESADEARQTRRFVPQEAAAVEAQTPFSRSWLPIVAQWEPTDEARQALRFVPQQQEAAADPPPARRRGWLDAVSGSWDSVPIPLWATGTVVQEGEAQARTPFARSWLPAVSRWELAYEVTQARRFVPQEVAPEKTPFARLWLGAAAQWEPDIWSAQRARALVQEGAAPVASTPFNRYWLRVVLEGWEPQAQTVGRVVRYTPEGVIVVPPAVDPPAGPEILYVRTGVQEGRFPVKRIIRHEEDEEAIIAALLMRLLQ